MNERFLIEIGVKYTFTILVIFVALTGCKKAEEPSAPDLLEGHFRLGDSFRLDFGTELSATPNRPTIETVLVRFKSRIYGADSFFHRSSRAVEGRVTFDVSGTESDRELLVYGSLQERSGRRDELNPLRVEVIEPGIPDETIETWLERAIGGVVLQLDGQVKVHQSSLDRLPDWTQHSDPLVRWSAIVALGERGTSKECPVVVGRLDDEEPEIRLAAAGAVARLGCSAIDELIETASQLSRERRSEVIPMIRLIADVGGPKALAYLEILRDGHGSARVREAASEAMKQKLRD
jgi:hypothetical protein